MMAALEGVIMLIILGVLCHSGFSVGSSCGSAVEGQPYQIHCSTLNTTGPVVWNDGSPLPICNCDLSCTCLDNKYAATWSSGRSTLTIKNVSRSLSRTTYSCKSDFQEFLSCTLSVFVIPKSPSCDDPSIDVSGVISVNCSAVDVFPHASCHFFAETNGTGRQELSPVIHITSSVPPFSCEQTVAASSLKWGNHSFYVEMYSCIDGQEYTPGGMSKSPLTTPVHIANPQVSLDPSCPKDYIKEGTPGSCTCFRSDFSDVHTVVKWINNIGAGGLSSDLLTFTADRSGPDFTCVGNNSLGWLGSVVFKPAVAYGPDQVFVQEKTGNSLFHYCSSPVPIQIQCQVPKAGVNPAPKLSITFNSTKRSGVVGTELSDMYIHGESYNVTQGGDYGVSCDAVVEEVQGLSKTANTRLEFTAAPSAPIFAVHQATTVSCDSSVTVKEGQAKFGCSVVGGYPTVSNISISCGQQSGRINSNEHELAVDITRQMMNVSCSCTATHPSICYQDNVKTCVLIVVYPGSVSDFKVSSVSSPPGSSVTVERRDNITFDCKTDGYPRPVGEIFLERVPGVFQSVVKENLQCNETGTYVCQCPPGNSEGCEEPSERTVQVNVRCGLQLENSAENSKIFSGTKDMDFIMDVRVFGFPPPTGKFWMLQEKNGDSEAKDVTRDYKVEYTEDTSSSPYGTVSLTIPELKESDFKNYSLIVNNSVGAFIYEFRISEAGEQDAKDFPVGAVVGGVAAGIFVIVTGIVIYIVLKRKGVTDRCQQGLKSQRMQNHGTDSNEVVTDNTDIYNMKTSRNAEVVTDNSDIYNMNRNRISEEVVVDNSALYGKPIDFRGQRNKDSMYKDYSDVVPTMTSATAHPKNLKDINQGSSNNSYEDVETSAHAPVQLKPEVPRKPKPAPKPLSAEPTVSKGASSQQNDTVDQTYTTVNLAAKSHAPKICGDLGKEQEDFFDQSKIPEVPEKKYGKAEKDVKNEKKKKSDNHKPKKTEKMPMLPRGNQTAGSHEDVDSSSANVYANSGFTGATDETNVYANTDRVNDDFHGKGDGTMGWL